jgi:hypothetical protein
MIYEGVHNTRSTIKTPHDLVFFFYIASLYVCVKLRGT